MLLGVLKKKGLPILDMPLATNISDISRFNHSVSSLLNTPQFMGGRLRLDGNTALSVAYTGNLSLGASDFLVEFKFQLDTAGPSYFLCKQEGALALRLTIGSTQIALRLYGTTLSSVLNPTVALSTGVEYHLAFERVGSTVTLYLNGVAIASDNTVNYVVATGTGNLIVGAYQDTSPPQSMPTGYIRKLRIFKQAMYKGNFTPPV